MGNIRSTPEDRLLDSLERGCYHKKIESRLKKVGNIDHIYPCGKTALFYSGYSIYVYDEIMKRRPNLNIRDKNGDVALKYVDDSCSMINDQTFDVTNINNNGESILFYKTLDEKKLYECIRRGVNINQTDINGKRCLHIPRIYTDAKILCSLGYNIDHEDNRGRTALFYAVEKINYHKIEYLLAAGANINHRDKDDNSVLSFHNGDKYVWPTLVLKFIIHGFTPKTLKERELLEDYYRKHSIRTIISYGAASAINRIKITSAYLQLKYLPDDLFSKYLSTITDDTCLNYLEGSKLDKAIIALEEKKIMSRFHNYYQQHIEEQKLDKAIIALEEKKLMSRFHDKLD